MPTVLVVRGWRLYFFSDEGTEPIHVHAVKAGAEAKIWLLVESFEIEFAHEHGLSPTLKRELRKIVFEHFDEIVEAWRLHLGERS